MITPKSSQYKRIAIAEAIYKHGPMRLYELKKIIRHISRDIIIGMIEDGQLSRACLNKQLSLTVGMTQFVAERVDTAKGNSSFIVPPRTAPEFKPLNPAYLPNLAGTRGNIEVRELHPITLASNVPYRRIDE